MEQRQDNRNVFQHAKKSPWTVALSAPWFRAEHVLTSTCSEKSTTRLIFLGTQVLANWLSGLDERRGPKLKEMGALSEQVETHPVQLLAAWRGQNERSAAEHASNAKPAA